MALNTYVLWPGVGQGLRRTRARPMPTMGQLSCEVTCGMTGLSAAVASTAQIESLWRGHWAIDNQVPAVRDATRGKNAGHSHTGTAPQR